MNEAAPITWLIDKINTLMSANLNVAATAIANTITPIVSICFGIYMLLIVVNYMRGAEKELVIDFGVRMAGFAVVIGLGLNMDMYTSTVIPMVTGLGTDIANAVSGGNVTTGTLDKLALYYINIIGDGFAEASPILNMGATATIFLKALIIIFGLVPFLIMATLTNIIANAGSVMVAMVGPIYFSFLLFPQTRQYASAWFNTALSYALIPIFVSVIATVSVGISQEMLSAGGSLSETSIFSVFLASIGNLTMLFLLKQVSSLASSLSAGGINAGMIGGGSLASGAAKGGKLTGKAAYRGGKAAYQGGKAAYQAATNKINNIKAG